jgi:hypothetical protein
MSAVNAMLITEDLAAGLPAYKVKLFTALPAFAGRTGYLPSAVLDRNLTLEDDFSEIIADGLKVIPGEWLFLNGRWFLNGEEFAAAR